MQVSRWSAIGAIFLATLLSAPAWGANPGQPGTINYVEGKVLLAGQPLDSESVGTAQLDAGQSLTTAQGRAEILLTPGVFLRVSDNSSVTMVSPDLANTEVRLDRGRAMVEVAEIHKENMLLIDQQGATTRLVKTGLYDFDADHGMVRVFDGQALVRTSANREVKLKGEHEIGLNGPAKSRKFDKAEYEDSFYRWASLRSDYLAEANMDTAQYYVSRGDWLLGAGWYWDPWYGAYTFVPWDGFVYSPFGWTYYSPGVAYRFPLAPYSHGFRHHDFRASHGLRGDHAVGGLHPGGPRRRG
jgi:FecR protein